MTCRHWAVRQWQTSAALPDGPVRRCRLQAIFSPPRPEGRQCRNRSPRLPNTGRLDRASKTPGHYIASRLSRLYWPQESQASSSALISAPRCRPDRSHRSWHRPQKGSHRPVRWPDAPAC